MLEQGGRIHELWEEKLSETKVNENYEQAMKEDEDKMLDNMEFAIQHIGEIANRVKELVNFVNPWCKSTISEGMNMETDFRIGDVVKVVGKGLVSRGWIGIVKKVNRRSQWPYIVKFHNREDGEYAQEEIELVPERFTEEENSKMKKITKERGGFGLEPDYDDLPDDWGSWNNYDGDEDDEGWDMDSSDYELSDDERRESERGCHPYLEKGEAGGDDMPGGPWLSEEDIIGMKVGESDEEPINWDDEDSYNDGGFERGMWVIWTDPDGGDESVWKILEMPKSEDDYFVLGQKDGSINEVPGWEIRPRDSDPEEYKEDNGEGFWKAMDDVDNLERKGYWSGKFKVGDKVKWIEPDKGYPSDGWTIEDVAPGKHPSGDDLYIINRGKSSVMNICGSELRPEGMINEANIVVDANTVWDVLDLLDDTDANNNLTDLINSHVRTEDEIMDAIDTACGVEDVSKNELNKLMTKNFIWIIDTLGLDAERFKETGEFVEKGKPTSVELESDQKFNVGDEITWRHHNGSLSNEVVRELTDGGYIVDDGFAGEKECYPGHVPEELLDKPNMEWDGKEWKQGIGMAEESGEAGETKKVTLYVDWDDDGAGLDSNVVVDVPAEIADSEETDALYDYISEWIDHQEFCVNDWMITDIEGLMDEGSEEVKKPEEVKSQDKIFNQDGENKTLVTGEEKKEMSDKEAATVMGGASATDMDAADIGVSSHEVADPYKKPVCEMTIEQEVPSPQSLLRLLWEQGKEHLMELLTSEYVDNDAIMPTLEDMGLRNLTEINDAFAYDFETILDSLGCDPDAWAERLEIVKKGGEEPVDEAKKKTKGAGDPEA